MVATPIGNLGDMTLRALETLKTVDAILCEDTRMTSRLLAHYEIKRPLVSCHEHTDDAKLSQLTMRLTGGESLAFVSDAGTPGLSDPGNKLVSFALEAGIRVIPIPGVSALTALVSVAGIDMREFVFLGFPPHKKGRETFFTRLLGLEYPAVYYESPHRVLKNLELVEKLEAASGEATPNRAPKRVIIGRELTKLFEEVVRGTVSEVLSYYREHESKIKGEFVVIVY